MPHGLIAISLMTLLAASCASVSVERPSPFLVCLYEGVKSMPGKPVVKVDRFKNRHGSWTSIEYTFAGDGDNKGKGNLIFNWPEEKDPNGRYSFLLDDDTRPNGAGMKMIEELGSRCQADWGWTDQVIITSAPQPLPAKRSIDMGAYN